MTPLFARKTADEGRASTTTLADDGDLKITGLQSGGIYRIEGLIVYDGGADNSGTGGSNDEGDIKFSFSVPSGSAGSPQYTRINESGQFAGGYITGGTGDDWTVSVTAQTTGVGTYMVIGIKGILVAGSNGVLRFRWAQDHSKSTNTHVRANSYLEALRVG